MERKYTSEEGLKFLNIVDIYLPPNEISLFKSEYDTLYQSCSRYESFVGTLWTIYSNILPFKVNPSKDDKLRYLEHLSRDAIFRENVIDSGLDKKIASGISMEELAIFYD